MSKKKAIILTVLAMLTSYGAAHAIAGPFGYDLEKDMHRDEVAKQQAAKVDTSKDTNTNTNAAPEIDLTPKTAKDLYSFVPLADLYLPSVDNNVYYSNPTVNSAIYKYKKGNYTGSLQELYAYIKKKPSDPYAFYYMGLNYSKMGENAVAAKCFQKVINCNAKGKLLELAVKGRDCINGGIYCKTPLYPTAKDLYNNNLLDPNNSLDQFISAPYTGNGFSPEAEKEYQQKQLDIQLKRLNKGGSIEQPAKTNNNQSAVPVYEKIAMAADIVSAEPTNEDVLNAIDVLKRAGLNITTGNVAGDAVVSDVAYEKKNPSSYINPEYEAINMMMGNSNNNDPLTSMLPYMMSSNENGKNIDPQIIQAVMMNSMMSSLNGLNSTDDK